MLRSLLSLLFAWAACSLPLRADLTDKPEAINEVKSMPTTKEGFSAQLYLTTNTHIFQEWVPDLRLPPVKKLPRNTPVLTLIVIANPGVNDEGASMVTYDLVIRKPDGSIYAEAPNMPGWKGRKAPPPGLVELARGTVTIKIDDGDPAGIYTVEAQINDHIKRCGIKITRSFLVEK